jgi:hypothetical protein
LQTSRYVDPVAVYIVGVADNVADVDADAEFDASVRWQVRVPRGHAALNVDGAAHGIDHADKLHQHSVAGRLNNAAAMLGDLGVDQFLTVRLNCRSVPSSSTPISRP